MTDSFVVDLNAGPYFQLPKYFVGGKSVHFSPEMLAHDTLGGSVAPHTAADVSMQQLIIDAVPDFLSWSSIYAANYDNFSASNANHTQWRDLVLGALVIVAQGGAIAPGFIVHGIPAPFVMGTVGQTLTYTPESTVNYPASTNDYSREQAGKWLLAVLNGGSPGGTSLGTHLSGDSSRIVGVELYNEPGTNNPQQYGIPGNYTTVGYGGSVAGDYPAGQGWYNDRFSDGQREEDFATNIHPFYADYLKALPGCSAVKIQGYSYSYGARAGPPEVTSLTRYVNCYPGSRQWQAATGSKNLGHFDLLALHGYTQISTGNIAGANKNDPQQAWNTIFHSSHPLSASPYTTPLAAITSSTSGAYDVNKDGMMAGFREKRYLLDQLGGSNVPLHLSEQWLIAGSGSTQNSIQAMADILGFIAAVQNAPSWFNGGGGYVVHCINASRIDGTYDATTSWPAVNDFMFGYQSSGAYRLHVTGRYYAFKHFLCKFGNRNGYQRLLPVTVTAANSADPVGIGNPVPRIQGVAGLNAAGTEMAFLLANIDMTNASTNCAFSWNGSAATGNVTGVKWAGNGSVPLDTPPTSLGTLATAGASSFTLTLAAGDCVLIQVPVSSSGGGSSIPGNSQAPTVSGSTVQGATLTANVGSWTNSPTLYTETWYRCDPNGANPVLIGGASLGTYATVSGDVGSTIQVGVVASNASGASSLIRSAPTGIITAAGGGGTSSPTLSSVTEVPTYATSDSRSVTCPSLTSGLMLFHFHRKYDTDALTALTYNGVSLTKLTEQTDGGHSVATEIWYMVAPPSGAHTLAWTKSGTNQNLGFAYSFWSGVDQTNPFGSPATYTSGAQYGAASGQTISGTLSANANDVVVAAATFNVAAANPTDGSGQTSLYADHQSTTQFASSYQSASAAGNVTVSESASTSGANVAFVAYLLRGNATGAAPVNSQSPVVTGSSVEQQVLTSTSGSWNDASATFAYQWQQSDPVTISWSNISSATASTYTIAVGKAGKILRSNVTATNSSGSASAPSQQTATVTNPGLATPPTNTVAPVASGQAIVGATEACDTGSYEASHPPTTYTYQWRRL